MIDIPVQSGEVVNLGRVGENQARRVIFDITDWNAEYPGATITLLNAPPGATDAYPVPSITVDGNSVYWIVESADVPKSGIGRCELIATLNDAIVKSGIYSTMTMKALDDTGEAPEPWESWQQVFSAMVQEASEANAEAQSILEQIDELVYVDGSTVIVNG